MANDFTLELLNTVLQQRVDLGLTDCLILK